MDIRHFGSRLTDHDIYLFRQGTHGRLYEKLGAHPCRIGDVDGVHFAVWAPNAAQVCVIGDFNHWEGGRDPLAPRWDGSGIWEGFVPGAVHGARYKYRITPRQQGGTFDKGDPFAFAWECPPRTASVVWETDYAWGDDAWMARRSARNALDAPMSVYEVHLGSWRRVPEHGNRHLGYREIAHALAEHVCALGFTHVELLPVMEHPFYGSWGYQTTGYFAPTARYGTAQDFMYFVDHLHARGIGVILDWVPSHFPADAHGLARFDGTHLYEHEDPRQGYHPQWHSAIFNYGRNEVRAFLISSALFWLDRYHVDALRVDAVASMLYLDYAREHGQWIPNVHGGKENLEAVAFLRELNAAVYRDHPGTQTIAEESTSWPMVSRPIYMGGLGFGLKWNMGWMHDTLDYMALDPVHRKHHHDRITFSIWYAFYENFVLSLSHDEVVYGKGSLLGRMPGDSWQKFASLRLLFAYMWTHPGKKLVFMGAEFAQVDEWYHEASLDWHLLEQPAHAGVMALMRDLNALLAREPALYALDFVHDGFEWIDVHDRDHSTLSWLRRGASPGDLVAVAFNFTPVPRSGVRLGVPCGGRWREVLNTDATIYGGSGMGNHGGADALEEPMHGRAWSIRVDLPPLAAIVLRPQ
ncbi:MAG: 1,4-alpha-glucan branching protein GlgB [Gammaproteobacteria bacterium]